MKQIERLEIPVRLVKGQAYVALDTIDLATKINEIAEVLNSLTASKGEYRGAVEKTGEDLLDYLRYRLCTKPSPRPEQTPLHSTDRPNAQKKRGEYGAGDFPQEAQGEEECDDECRNKELADALTQPLEAQKEGCCHFCNSITSSVFQKLVCINPKCSCHSTKSGLRNSPTATVSVANAQMKELREKVEGLKRKYGTQPHELDKAYVKGFNDSLNNVLALIDEDIKR